MSHSFTEVSWCLRPTIAEYPVFNQCIHSHCKGTRIIATIGFINKKPHIGLRKARVAYFKSPHWVESSAAMRLPYPSAAPHKAMFNLSVIRYEVHIERHIPRSESLFIYNLFNVSSIIQNSQCLLQIQPASSPTPGLL